MWFAVWPQFHKIGDILGLALQTAMSAIPIQFSKAYRNIFKTVT